MPCSQGSEHGRGYWEVGIEGNGCARAILEPESVWQVVVLAPVIICMYM